MAGRNALPNLLSNDHDQMTYDFNNPELNSYDTGPGLHLKQNQIKGNCGNTKLFVGNIPSGLTEEGLLNIFSSEGDIPENVYIHRKSNLQSNMCWGFVTFKSVAAAQNAMCAIHKKPPYHFFVQFARSDDEKLETSKDSHSKDSDDRKAINALETSKDSHSKDSVDRKAINAWKSQGSFPVSSRGRGKLPPMQGQPPSAFKAIRPKEEPYIETLEEDCRPGWFSHCGTSFEHNVSNSLFSSFADGDYDDGKRKMTMGRGSYIVHKESLPITNEEPIIEGPQDLEHRIAAYLGNKAKDFLFDDKEAIVSTKTKISLPVQPGSCSYCTRPAIYICSNCKCWYCTNYCRKKHWNVHKSSCIPRTLVFQNGVPVYTSLSEATCSKPSYEATLNDHFGQSNGHGNSYDRIDGPDFSQTTEDDKASVSYERFENDFRNRKGSLCGRESEKENCRSTPISDSKDRHGEIKQTNKANRKRSYNKQIKNNVLVKSPPSLQNGTFNNTQNGNKGSLDGSPIPALVFTRITIGSVGKDGEFFAFRADDCSKQAAILEKLNEYCTNDVPSITNAEVGSMCAALFEGDWYRAKIIDTSKQTVTVKYIDFGNESNVRKTDLKKMPQHFSSEPALAHTFVLAPSSTNPSLEENATLSVKPLSKDTLGRWIVVVEGTTNYENDKELEDGAFVCQVEGNDNQPEQQVRHFLSLLENNSYATIKIEKIMNEDFLTGSLIDEGRRIYEDISKVISAEVVPNKNMKLVLGMTLAAKWQNNWYRGYLMAVRDSKPIVALIDKGRVVIPLEIGPLPKKVLNAPEYGVRVISDIVFDNNAIGKTICVKNIKHNYENNYLEGEFDNGGKVVVLPWVPALEEAGLDCIKIPSGSRVKISAYHSASSIYVQSCDPKHKKMCSEIIQDVASFTKGEPLKRKPFIGEFLACRYIEDGYYYRAQVFLKEGDKYKVNFVDYGNTELVSQQDMKHLPEDLKRVPCCAVRIGLKDVPDVPFNTQCMKFLNELAADSIEMFLTYENDLRQATLELCEGEILNNILFSLLEPSWEKKDLYTRSPHIFLSSDIKYDTWKKGSKFEISIALVLRYDRILALRPASGLLNHVENTLTPNIVKYCESIPNEVYNPRRSEVCLAKFHEDGKWYRALCLQSYQHNAAEVIFIDYGNKGEVLHRCLRRMVPEFMETPAVVKCCKIYGLPSKLPEATETALKDYLSTFRGEAELLEELEDGNSIIWIPALASFASKFGISIKHPN